MMLRLSAIQLIDPDKANIPRTNNDALQRLLTDFFVLLGAITVLMIIIGGFRYIAARGNPETIKSARNTIIYSITGLIIAALAASIVNFLLGRAG